MKAVFMHFFSAFVFSILVSGSVGAALAQDAAAPPPQNAATLSLPAITVSQVRRAVATDRVVASGLIGAVETVLVQPQIEGEAIEAITVEVGDSVVAGQELARLSDSALILQKSQLVATRASAEAAVAQAEASVVESQASADEAVRARDRADTLAAQGSATAAAAEQAGAAAAGALARVNVALQSRNAAMAQRNLVDAQIADLELRLTRTRIVAPVDGVVVARNAVIGAIASGGAQPLFEIVRDGALELRADVAEEDILRLQTGQEAQLAVIGQRAPLAGRVHLVEPAVNAVTRLGRVRITLDQPDLVRPGMFAEATITVVAREALVVPASAVGGGASGATAMIVRDGLVSVVPIVTGIRDGDVIEVVEGLDAGDSVVTKAGAFVRDGDRINPVPAS